MKDIVPAHYRAIAYRVWAIATLIASATQVGFAAAMAAQPVALTVILAVLAFLGVGLGFVAAANTPVKDISSRSDGL